MNMHFHWNLKTIFIAYCLLFATITKWIKTHVYSLVLIRKTSHSWHPKKIVLANNFDLKGREVWIFLPSNLLIICGFSYSIRVSNKQYDSLTKVLMGLVTENLDL